MVSLIVIFWMYVVLFAIIGGMRGWAKELLVTFSVILALTFTTLLASYVPFIRDDLSKNSPAVYFWVRAIILGLLVFFGYQTPNIPRFATKVAREKIQDIILGVVIGAFNGYLIVGSLWLFMAEAQYPFSGVVSPPPDNLAGTVNAMLNYMPPRILGIPGIYFAVVTAFIFVIVVFI